MGAVCPCLAGDSTAGHDEENPRANYGATGNDKCVYLVWSDTSMGCMFMHYTKPTNSSETTLCKITISRDPPAFKLQNNGGRQELGKNCGDKSKFFSTYMTFLRESFKLGATSITIVGQATSHAAQIKILDKSNTMKTCSGGSLSVNAGNTAAIAVLGKDNNALNASSMEPKFFVQKAMNEGAGEMAP
ncbi:unnamed protein product [Amoebophrya sp. A120]|nr:unnamed protein product [Amoebophrya sp. A120]|eukprot:GSA120T00013357001.1